MKFKNKITGEIKEFSSTLINSALLTAQNRKRNYWANWGISQPEDKEILLKDIIEGGTIDAEQYDLMDIANRSNFGGFSENKEGIRPYKNDSAKSGFSEIGRVLGADAEKAPTVTCSHAPKVLLRPCDLRDGTPLFDDWIKDTKGYGGTLEEYNRLYKKPLCHHVATATDIKANESNKRIYDVTGKSPTLTTMQGGHQEPKVLVGRIVGRKINPETGKRDDYNPDLKTVQRLEARPDEKSGCITTVQKDNVLILDAPKYRKLTPRECMRLQAWPTWVIDKLLSSGISNSQLYKMTGNGFTHAVIVHNLQCLLDTGWKQ